MRTSESSAHPVGSPAAPATRRAPARVPGDYLELLHQHLGRLIRIDAGILLTRSAEGELEPASEWWSSPRLAELIGPALYGGGEPGLAEIGLDRGRPLFLPRLADWEAAPATLARLAAALDGDRAAQAWATLSRASAIACPVKTALGRALGVLVVISVNPDRMLERSDLELVEVLADLGAVALERHELLDADAERARSDLLLKRASEGVSASLEAADIEQAAIHHAVRVTGAGGGRLSRIVPGGSGLATAAEVGAAGELDAAALSEAARSRTPQPVPGPPAQLHVPVALGPRLFGVLSVTRAAGAFGDDALERLQSVAKTSAGAIANALDFDRERRIARALTRGFVPAALPDIHGHEIGLVYEPADDQPVGGDLYGAWTLPDGRAAVLVGDVAGKGIETAALSAMARFFIEARSFGASGPAEVLQSADAMLRERLPEDTFVTAMLAILDSDGLTLASAGHLPPLLARSGGGSEWVAAAGVPLGIDAPGGLDEVRIALAPGDILFGYTDGLVEARHQGELFGQDRLAGAIEAELEAAPGVAQLASRVHEHVRDWSSGLADDVVALVVLRS